MKMISTMALAAALLAGSGVAPAAGKKEVPQPESATNFILSKQVRDSALAANLALKAGDLQAAGSAVAAVEASASNDSERFIAKTLRVKLLSKSPQNVQSMSALIKPLDELIVDPRTSKDDVARYNYTRGDIAYAQKLYARAAQYYIQARQNGLQDDELGLQVVRAYMEAGNVTAGAEALDGLIAAQVAAGKKPPESWYRFAAQRLRTKKAPEAVAWTGKWLAAYGTRANWHDAIAINGFKDEDESQLTPAERLERNRRFVDLLRLMRVTHSLAGQKEYTDYAKRANSLGLKDEARSVIEEGRASGAIPAKDTETTQILAQTGRPAAKGKAKAKPVPAAAAAAAPSDTAARKAKDGELAMQLGDVSIGQAAYAKAVEMYDLALEKTVKDTDTLRLHRGIAYALAGDKEKARSDFDAVTQSPVRETAQLWTIWLESPPAA
ncbi:MAG: hypothetical protein JWN66_556 [Sphingomonas bacterium]|uniref:hypothetical protein n=1 Tax=Sphingomonas bacterium TaxID=1895847 RepID=UPI00261B38A3|nr:hypothetical protein [Sphingomonas bacterium]MDB5703440.1 hypothetical protein [Sphingomonas bacterium]